MGRDWYIIKSGLKAGIDGFIWEDSRLLCFMPQNSTLIEFQQLLFSFQLYNVSTPSIHEMVSTRDKKKPIFSGIGYSPDVFNMFQD